MKRNLFIFCLLALMTQGWSAVAQPEGPVEDTRQLQRPGYLRDRREFVRPRLLVNTTDEVVAAAPALTPSPTTAPATQPIDHKISRLINQLGDDDPRLRDTAVAELRKLGRVALPALKQAVLARDAQVRTNAESLIAEMNARPARAPRLAEVPQPPPGGIVLRGGQIILNNVRAGNVQGQMQVQMQVVGNGRVSRDVTVTENGRKVHVHEDNDGVKVEVTDKGETKEYAAKTAAELKEKEPEAYKHYERYLTDGLGRLNIRVEP